MIACINLMGEHFTIKELADKLKVSPATVRRRMQEIPNFEVGYIGRLIRIPEDQALRLLKRVQRFAKGK